MTILAIDFGTSRIKAAYWDEESGKAVVLPLGKGGRLYVPSLFHVSKDGKIRFGDEAEVMLHHDPQGIVENLKLDLDKPIKYVPNGQQVKSAELMALLFRRIIEYATRQVPAFGGSAPKTLVLTLPSRWDYSDIYMDALDTIGYTGEKVVIREPEAAGLAWVAEQSPKPEDMLVVLDFGGGTIDWACLRVDEKGQPQMIAELPPGGITAAGSHVDAGLFDEMMKHINEEQRQEVQQRRAQVLEQIRQLKESQNGNASLSGEDGLLEVQLGAEAFVYPKKLFEQVVRREVIDQAVEGIGWYMKKVARYEDGVGKTKQIWCVLTGGTRLLSGLMGQLKARIQAISKDGDVSVLFADVREPDFATVMGAVLRARPSSKAALQVVRTGLLSILKWRIELLKSKDVSINQDTSAVKLQDLILRDFGVQVSEFEPVKVQHSQQEDVPENFVLIRGGEFTMGSPENEVLREREETQHQVRISDFYMCRYAVTVAEYKEFIDASGYRTDAEKENSSYVTGFFRWKNKVGINWRFGVSGIERLKGEFSHPVLHVSSNDAVAYCEWRKVKSGKRFRLPTEAEWEYACRAGTTTPYNVGHNLPSNLANSSEYRKNTVAVDSFEPNAWGLHNMHGNVWESCSDWYDSGYYRECKVNGMVENPAGPVTGFGIVVRGGSWKEAPRDCRSARRGVTSPSNRSGNSGFRLVFVP